MKNKQKKHSGKMNAYNKIDQNLGTKRNEFGPQGSAKGTLNPQNKREGRPTKSGDRPNVKHG